MYLCWCIPAFTGIVSVVLSPKLSELWQQSLSRPHLWQAHSGLGFCVHKLSPQSRTISSQIVAWLTPCL